MFLKILKNMTSSDIKPTSNKGLALATLFLQLARADNDYSNDEHEMILTVLEDRYKITKIEAEKILATATTIEKDTTDTVQITREIKSVIPYEERAGILADLWRIIMADKKRSNEENNFMRLVTKLLGMPDRLSAQIRMEVVRTSQKKNNPIKKINQ